MNQTKRFTEKTVLITAGPTYEELDPVRFIGNYSTGKMGFALAEAFAAEGAKVILIAGPTYLQISNPNIARIDVTSADQMFAACLTYFERCEVAVMAAAVADYKPISRAANKIKKSSGEMVLELTRTVDIARELGIRKRRDQFLVGFALETENEAQNATQKLVSKRLDLIVLNSLRDEGAGFRHDTNKVKILTAERLEHGTGLMHKSEIAKAILDVIALKTSFAAVQI